MCIYNVCLGAKWWFMVDWIPLFINTFYVSQFLFLHEFSQFWVRKRRRKQWWDGHFLPTGHRRGVLPSPAPSSHSSEAMDGTFCQLVLRPWHPSEPCAQLRGWFCPGDNPTVSPMYLSSSAPLFLSIPSGRSTWKHKAKTGAQAQDHSLTQLSPAIPTPSLRDPSSVILPNLTRGCL